MNLIKIIALVSLVFMMGCSHLTISGECEAEMKKDFFKYQSMDQCRQAKMNEQAQLANGLSGFNSEYNKTLDQQKSLQPKQTDQTCLSQCLAAGYMMGLCNNKCSY